VIVQIIHVKIPYANQGPNKSQKHFAYVEFGDEESMKAGLASRGEVCCLLEVDLVLALMLLFRNCATLPYKSRLRMRTVNLVEEDVDVEGAALPCVVLQLPGWGDDNRLAGVMATIDTCSKGEKGLGWTL
jgi:hypothetical protein